MADSELQWDDDALARLEKIPSFVRGMAKGKIEKGAVALGATRVTAELMDKIKKEEMGG